VRHNHAQMNGRSVLVTGCSTGIGRATALRLGRRGWKVFAAVRKDEDAEDLKAEATGQLITLILDVVDQASIDAAAKHLGEELGDIGLAGLVNNAGISVHGPLEYLPIDELRRQFEVNVFGQIAVTQSFLPLIRKATGRIVFVGSVGGRAPSIPLIGPYIASKYALEALAESLRTELMKWGIKVSVVEPGAIKTAIWGKGETQFDGSIAEMSSEARERYEKMMKRGLRIASARGRHGTDAEKVAVRIEDALTAKRPRIHYLVGADARLRTYVESNVPKPLRDRIIKRVLGLS
jgi:NAD(P)-dependent dehydrogenase (short-subunit alcohol dehydrogenase family)